MKIRRGFVSNSSSASFIVKWRKTGGDIDPQQNFLELVEGDSYAASNLGRYVMEHSVIANGWIETKDYTIMMNDMGDFSEEIKRLLMYLAVNKQFEYEASVDDY